MPTKIHVRQTKQTNTNFLVAPTPGDIREGLAYKNKSNYQLIPSSLVFLPLINGIILQELGNDEIYLHKKTAVSVIIILYYAVAAIFDFFGLFFYSQQRLQNNNSKESSIPILHSTGVIIINIKIHFSCKRPARNMVGSFSRWQFCVTK